MKEKYDYMADGFYYKVGLHNFVYRWGENSWIKSGRTIKELKIIEKRNKAPTLSGLYDYAATGTISLSISSIIEPDSIESTLPTEVVNDMTCAVK